MSKVGFEAEIVKGPYADFTRKDLIEALDGGTDISTEVARQIQDGKIHINILGDELFDATCPKDCVGTTAYFKEGQIYIRKNSESLLSDLVHEGNHAIDFRNKVIQTTFEAEYRSYKAEQLFQIEKNLPIDFLNDDEILVHIYTNYENGIFYISE